jgi:transposase-like protein
VIPDTDGATILPIVNKWVAKGSIMVTDEWRAYDVVRKDFFHVTVNHAEGNYVNGAFSTNGVENFWSIFKRGITGVFHSISPQHLQAYVDEFADRYSDKDISQPQRFESLVKRAPNRRLTYKQALSRKQAIADYLRYRTKDLPL